MKDCIDADHSYTGKYNELEKVIDEYLKSKGEIYGYNRANKKF